VSSAQLQPHFSVLVILCALLSVSTHAQKPVTAGAKTKDHTTVLLRKAVREGIAGAPGAAVVVEVETGKILAQQGIQTAGRRLATPGSTVKPFVLMALLRSQRLRPDETFFCPRTLRIAGRRMDCTHPEVAAPLDAEQALAYSCNSYFAAMAGRIGAEELASELRRAGFDSPSGLWSHEVAGIVNTTQTPEELELQALGENAVKVTPLELLAAYRTLAVERRTGDQTWDVIYRGLADSTAYGMAHAAAPDGYSVAGKTGTANSPSSALTHGWFAGYAPAGKPEIALVVYLEHGRGSDAARVARTVFAAYGKAKGKL
jgi:cell division protein FtsI/penicillin-binding protein 2